MNQLRRDELQKELEEERQRRCELAKEYQDYKDAQKKKSQECGGCFKWVSSQA